MTTPAAAAPPSEHPAATDPTMNGNARAAGFLYLFTFVLSIPALVLIGPVLHDAGYLTGPGHDVRVTWGCLLDVVNAFAAVGTAVALFPLVKRQNESLALGFVTSRMMEAAVIMIGVVSLLAVVTLRQDHAGLAGDTTSLTTTGQALVDVRDRTFLLGPGLMPAVNALLLGTLLYRSRLVPRIIPIIGLVGAPLLLVSALATLFGLSDQVSAVSGILTVPVAAWELALGLWLAVKGVDPAAVAALTDPRRGCP